MAVSGFWRFTPAGRLAEHWEAVADTAAWDAFWNAPLPTADRAGS
jgi:hypothetical protein